MKAEYDHFSNEIPEKPLCLKTEKISDYPFR